jgi:hypothetical protein
LHRAAETAVWVDEELQLIMNPVAQDKGRDAQQEKGSDEGDELLADGATPVVARRRVFLLLEAHREFLAARVRRHLLVRRRYEDLCLLKMVTRLQRDYLRQPAPSAKPPAGGIGAEYGIADWARPWGPAFLLQFQADLNVFDLKLGSLGKWLSTASQRKARASAAKRFASITAGMASQLEAAEFVLPGWASRKRLSQHLPSQRAPSRAEPGAAGRGAARRGSRRRTASVRAAPGPAAPARNGRPAARDGRINLNRASFAELRSLDLSVTQSHRLLAYRKRIGSFESLEQLNDVPGFPSAVRERLKRRATI